MQRMLNVNATMLGLMLALLSLTCSVPSYAAALHSSASAQFSPGPNNNRQNNNQQNNNLVVSSAQQAVQMAQRSYSGKVLKVQSANVNGHPGYRIKLLTNDGVIFYVLVDATNGSVTRN
ncbi:PepSY domain-containing protein [Shewanella sp. SG41-4]|uniref:PepSY domain-containing protein n=1 Tax=Shewanella sp. SG41-4 TaxID=2760976 RepID=UPI002175E7A5|nr:PepSY domain-containing protein [Shewanella sp. SG41-4]